MLQLKAGTTSIFVFHILIDGKRTYSSCNLRYAVNEYHAGSCFGVQKCAEGNIVSLAINLEATSAQSSFVGTFVDYHSAKFKIEKMQYNH
jgi:hypothetical protein